MSEYMPPEFNGLSAVEIAALQLAEQVKASTRLTELAGLLFDSHAAAVHPGPDQKPRLYMSNADRRKIEYDTPFTTAIITDNYTENRRPTLMLTVQKDPETYWITTAKHENQTDDMYTIIRSDRVKSSLGIFELEPVGDPHAATVDEVNELFNQIVQLQPPKREMVQEQAQPTLGRWVRRLLGRD